MRCGATTVRPKAAPKSSACRPRSLKRTWVGGGKGRDWFDTKQAGGRAVLAHASQVKNVWIPYGV